MVIFVVNTLKVAENRVKLVWVVDLAFKEVPLTIVYVFSHEKLMATASESENPSVTTQDIK